MELSTYKRINNDEKLYIKYLYTFYAGNYDSTFINKIWIEKVIKQLLGGKDFYRQK